MNDFKHISCLIAWYSLNIWLILIIVILLEKIIINLGAQSYF